MNGGKILYNIKKIFVKVRGIVISKHQMSVRKDSVEVGHWSVGLSGSVPSQDS
jgi:hypothetical protein